MVSSVFGIFVTIAVIVFCLVFGLWWLLILPVLFAGFILGYALIVDRLNDRKPEPSDAQVRVTDELVAMGFTLGEVNTAMLKLEHPSTDRKVLKTQLVKLLLK